MNDMGELDLGLERLLLRGAPSLVLHFCDRLDVEGLDPAKSYGVLERYKPEATRAFRNDQELQWLIGTGVSAAAIFHIRASLDDAGFDQVKIVASSGFGPEKCKVMASVKAPINIIGSSGEPEGHNEDIPGDDDGTVAVREAHLAGEDDSVTLPLGHTRLSFDDRMIHQVLHFLKNRRFAH